MSHQPVVVGPDGLAALIAALHSDGFRVLGPTVRDDAIVYDDVATVDDLPAGWTDEQDGGRYRLKRRGDDALFGYAVGPHAWKRFLHPPLLRLWRAEPDADGLQVTTDAKAEERFAFLAVRSCELHAIAIQDKVFLQGPYVDPHYKARRDGVFIVAVNCGEAGGTCFCTSMNTGPKASTGYGPGADRTARRDARIPSGSRQRTRRGPAGAPAAAAIHVSGLRPRRCGRGEHRRQYGSADALRRCTRTAARQPGAQALGRRRRPLPVLRQLHAGLPDLLLHRRHRRQRPVRRDRADAAL